MQALYVMQAEDGSGPVKVGISGDPNARCVGVSAAADIKMRLVHCTPPVKNARTAERAAHSRLAKHRLQGEWFSVDPAVAIAAVDGVVRVQRYNEGTVTAAELMPAILAKFGGSDRALHYLLERRPEILLVLESWE